MNEPHKYRATDKMSDLICDNYSLLMVMSRLSLGFGDRSVKDVCQAQGVDYKTFLAVANFISHEPYTYSGEEDDFSLTALMDYLKQAHTYFLDFNLPAIRRKLIEDQRCGLPHPEVLRRICQGGAPPHGVREPGCLHLRGRAVARPLVRYL